MQEYSKKVKRLLRELNEEAYTRELNSELSKLSTKFDYWKQGELNCHELSDAIHEFHSKPSRELFGQYTSRYVDLNIFSAIRRGIFAKEDIPEKVYKALRESFPSLDDPLE